MIFQHRITLQMERHNKTLIKQSINCSVDKPTNESFYFINETKKIRQKMFAATNSAVRKKCQTHRNTRDNNNNMQTLTIAFHNKCQSHSHSLTARITTV